MLSCLYPSSTKPRETVAQPESSSCKQCGKETAKNFQKKLFSFPVHLPSIERSLRCPVVCDSGVGAEGSFKEGLGKDAVYLLGLQKRNLGHHISAANQATIPPPWCSLPFRTVNVQMCGGAHRTGGREKNKRKSSTEGVGSLRSRWFEAAAAAGRDDRKVKSMHLRSPD